MKLYAPDAGFAGGYVLKVLCRLIKRPKRVLLNLKSALAAGFVKKQQAAMLFLLNMQTFRTVQGNPIIKHNNNESEILLFIV